MQLVPFNPAWADPGGKLDLHAVYQRGDVVSAFPMRRHQELTVKGFRYVTLETRDDVMLVRDGLRMKGVDLNALDSSYDKTPVGRFKYGEYNAGQPERDAKEVAELEAQAVELKARMAKIDKAKKV